MKPLSAAKLLLALALCIPFAAPSAAAEKAPTERALITRYMLMDTHGQPVSDGDFAGSFQLITFGYTSCPDICPTTMAEMALVMKRLGDLSELVQPIFITVDPERDTPETLERFTAYFHPRTIGLTGSPEMIRRVADNYKVSYKKHIDPGGDPKNYAVDHTAGMYLLGPDGHFVTKFSYNTPVSDITEKLRTIIESTADLSLPQEQAPTSDKQ